MPGLILFVDDEPAAAVELALAALGPVRVFRSAESAAAFIENGEAVAAVVTDLDFPSMDGLALIQRIRTARGHKNTPIVVVSGSAEPDAPARAMALGAGAFFSKPCSPGKLRRRVEDLMHEMPHSQ